MAVLWIEFITCSALIVVSGAYLSRYGDVIAEKTGLGRAWVGLVLMASITSLPELITGISSVTIVDAPDIALGDVMGSCIYNLAILALMDAVNGQRPLFLGADRGHLLSSGFGVMLISVVIIAIFVGDALPAIGHVGLYTPIIIVVYFIGVRAVFYYEQDALHQYVEGTARKPLYKETTLKRAVYLYVINGLVIIGAATFLPFIAKGLATATGLGDSFVGTALVAMTTSLPEVIVSLSAVRIGAQDMAIANMLGSNMFNILVLAIDDIFYTDGPLLAHISETHAVTGLVAIIMTATVVIGITYPPEKKEFSTLTACSVTLALLWVTGLVLVYFLGAAP